MSVQVNIYEAKSKFSKLINQAIAGEEIIIAKSGKPNLDRQKAKLSLPMTSMRHYRMIFCGSFINEIFAGHACVFVVRNR